MYSKEELLKLVDEIENGETYSDLGINEKVFVITRLLGRTINLIAGYMLDTEEDVKYAGNMEKAYKILQELNIY